MSLSTVAGVRSRDLVLNGVRVRCHESGEGPPLLLIHGIAASSLDWSQNIAALARQYHVIAPDLPGFGESEVPKRPYRLPQALAFLDGLYDAYGLRSTALIGNSLGGLICGHYAIAHPERVNALVLVSPAGLSKEVSFNFRLLTLPWLGERIVRPGPNTAKIAVAGLLADPAKAPSAWLADKGADYGEPSRQYLLDTLRSGTNFLGLKRNMLFLDGLRSLTMPLLIIWGDQDRVIPSWHLQLAKRYLPHARTVIFENAGHVPMIEWPDRFNALVLDFLAENRVAATPA